MSDPRKSLKSSIQKIGDSKNNGVSSHQPNPISTPNIIHYHNTNPYNPQILPRQSNSPHCSEETVEKFRSFCDSGDVRCDSGEDFTKDGTYYVDKYAKEATEFFKSQVRKYGGELWKDERSRT